MAENFVLVHGAWHGGWCWASVMRQLELAGHHAFTLDLAGRGANPMNHAKVTGALWVEDVVRLIEQRDLKNVVLAGHSLGGLTISGVAVKIPQRIKRLIYVTALVPPEDMTLMDDFVANMMTPETAAAMQEVDGGLSTMMEANYFRRYFIQDGSRDLQDFVLAALSPEAAGPLGEIAPMRQFHQLDLPTSYVICEDDFVAGDPRKWHPGQSKRLRNPTTASIKAGHEVMFTQPVKCARALMDLARG